MAERDTRYVPFFKKCAERAGKEYPREFAKALISRLGKSGESRHVLRVLSGEKLPTRELLEAATSLAGSSLEHCIHLPMEWSARPTIFPIVWEKEQYYRLLTAIYESHEKYWIRSIEGNLYGMHIATGKPLPIGVPPPPIENSQKNESDEVASDGRSPPPIVAVPVKTPRRSHR